MAALPYIQLYVSDYLADTAHLSTLEHGAYLLLIFNYWQRGEPFLAKDEQTLNKRLAAITRLTSEEWADASETLSEFFKVSKNEWRHERIDRDLLGVISKSVKASAAGKASAEKRAGKSSSERSTDVKQTLNHTDTDTDTDTDIVLTTTTVVENENEGLSLSARKAVAPKEVKQTKSDVQVVFDFWREVMQHNKARLDGKREKCIRDALKIGYSVDELLSAIRGCSLTPHNMGGNEQQQRFDGLAIIFKSADQIDRFIANSINPPQQKSPNAPAKNGSGFERQRGNYDRNNKISQSEWKSTDF